MKKLRSLLALALVLVAAPVWAQVNPGTSPLTVPKGGTGRASVTSGLPLIGSGAAALGTGSKTGNTTNFATASGSFIPTNCVKTDANGNLVDAAAPCGTGTTTANVQDFIAGTGFTAGTTTALTVSATPISKASTAVYFDGRLQSDNTWTLAGSTLTFSAAIPSSIQVVEIKSLSAAVLPTWVTSIGGVNGAITLGTGLGIASSTLSNTGVTALGGLTGSVLLGPGLFTSGGNTLNQNVASVDNLLPNVQWQLWTGTQFITKQNAAGTGNQTAASCSGFTTVTQVPSITCANTQQIRLNDIVILSNVSFWGYAGGGFITCAQVQCTLGDVTGSRVIQVVTNSSIGIQSNFGATSPAGSAAITVTPIAPGDLGTVASGADGWTKTTTMIATVDDWGAAATPASTAYPGCIRPLLLRKGITGNENYQWAPAINSNNPALSLAKYAGQTITFGVVVYQRIQGGANTWRLYITDSSGTTNSALGTGASFGGYQFLTVTRTIAANATSLAIGLQTQGNSSDVYDVCLPTAAFTSSLVQSQLKQNSGEIIRAVSHFNPPLLTPYIINFPSTQLVAGSGLFGYNSIDLEAISHGTVHNSVGNVYCKLEWTGTNPGKNVFFGGSVTTNFGLTFGLQNATAVSGVQSPGPIARVPLFHDGTVAIYTDQSGMVPITGTFDFTDVDVTPPITLNFLLKRDVNPGSNDNEPMWLEQAA